MTALSTLIDSNAMNGSGPLLDAGPRWQHGCRCFITAVLASSSTTDVAPSTGAADSTFKTALSGWFDLQLQEKLWIEMGRFDKRSLQCDC